MALTANLVARAARAVEDPGLLPGSVYLDDADYAALVRGTLSEAPPEGLCFAVNRRGRGYAGRLPPGEAADLVAGGAGHWGSCAEYLRETVARLEALGIRDRNLWRPASPGRGKDQGRVRAG
jgi:hypothetical protein